MKKDFELIDNKAKRRYEFHIGELTSKIEYLISDRGVIYLTHTEVPQELKGQGIGSQLVLKTLIDIENRGLKLMPLCPFVATYIHRHPQWNKIIMPGVAV